MFESNRCSSYVTINAIPSITYDALKSPSSSAPTRNKQVRFSSVTFGAVELNLESAAAAAAAAVNRWALDEEQ